ncbi:MAG: hypothetical protein B6I28_05405 [Fusobacteriia bacterium 4572_132]|nr:MAG: hypothetical protein B6I28_05405 [Fusobacteriia bacterium 4572_132]
MIKGEISKIKKDSIAEELGIEVGDGLLKIDGKIMHDMVEYEHAIYKEYLEVEILKTKENEIWELEIEKDEYEDLGLEFENPLFDGIKTCRNNCLFCFVSQLPRKMRKSLYIKDEDFRMSFLYGSYTTLSNMEEEDLQRIIREKLSPQYVSVHATDFNVRRNLLRNENIKDIIQQLEILTENGIEIYAQAVLMPGINDGKVLEKTIEDLAKFYPMVKGVTIVPIGLTKYHKNGLRLFKKEESKKVVKYVLEKGKEYNKKFGEEFCILSDEFFIQSEIDFPKKEYYGDYENLENGVGLVSLLLEEAKKIKKRNLSYTKKGTIVCGISIYKYMKEIFKREENLKVIPIKNYFFGESITVTGLITGSDLLKNLEGVEIGEELILNKVMLNNNVFLDDYTVEDISKKLEVNIKLVEKLEDIYKK